MVDNLILLLSEQRNILAKLRTSNHNVPIKLGRRRNIDSNKKLFTLCNTNDTHYILECPFFNISRRKYITLQTSGNIVNTLHTTFRNETIINILPSF